MKFFYYTQIKRLKILVWFYSESIFKCFEETRKQLKGQDWKCLRLNKLCFWRKQEKQKAEKN